MTFAALGKAAIVLALAVVVAWGVFALHGAYRAQYCATLSGQLVPRGTASPYAVCLTQWP